MRARDPLAEWRVEHGAPPWRGWRYANEDPLVLAPVWVLVAYVLLGLGANGGVAIIGTLIVLAAQVHISRAIRRKPQGPGPS